MLHAGEKALTRLMDVGIGNVVVNMQSEHSTGRGSRKQQKIWPIGGPQSLIFPLVFTGAAH
jgi:hypothetical protein